MPQPNDLSRSLVALDQNSTIIAVVELSQSSWLVGGVLPGIERQPRKKLEPNPERLLGLLHRWRDEAVRAGRTITRIAVAFEAGRDGFWLARWLEARGVEAHVIHPSSVAISREHRRAKTDRLVPPQEIGAELIEPRTADLTHHEVYFAAQYVDRLFDTRKPTCSAPRREQRKAAMR